MSIPTLEELRDLNSKAEAAKAKCDELTRATAGEATFVRCHEREAAREAWYLAIEEQRQAQQRRRVARIMGLIP